MKIIENDGRIVECTTQEYKEIYGMKYNHSSAVIRTEPVVYESKVKNKYNKDITRESWSREEDTILKNNSIPEAKRLLPNRTLISLYSRRAKIGIARNNTDITRKKWHKSEDRIAIMNSDKSLREIKKLLPNRTENAIYSRLHNHLLKHSTRRGRLLRSDDKRISMMQYVSQRTKELVKLNPLSPRNALMKIAMQDYRNKITAGVIQ